MSPPVLAISDGGVVLGGRPVLRGIDLTVRAGEVVAVLGANGSGKSTLVRAALGLTPLHTGSVDLFETPLSRFRDWRRIGYVPQRISASGGVPASVAEVVAAGRLARRHLLRPAGQADREAVRRALAAVDLADRARDRVSELSGGQQQRVLIARALAGEPDLLVLDEPTAGIDLDSQETLAGLLRGLNLAGVTLIVVAHELGFLAPLFRRAVVMRDGRLAYDGEPLESFREVERHHAHGDASTRPRDYTPDLTGTLDVRSERPVQP